MRRAIAARHAHSLDTHGHSAQLGDIAIANGICDCNARGRALDTHDTHAWADDANTRACVNCDTYSSADAVIHCNAHACASDIHALASHPYAAAASYPNASAYSYADGHSNAYDYAYTRAGSLGGGARAE